jgi:diguanylate cyclase (GGDEF)-like protein
MKERLERVSNFLMSLCAGIASFIFTLTSLLLLGEMNERIAAAIVMGLFALLIVWVASEKPNTAQSSGLSALIDRLLAVATGDLTSPAPEELRRTMPSLAAAVDNLFEQVRCNLENVHAMALYDPVTSLPNRVHFKREADRLLKARNPEEHMALLFIDLDGFKEVNDNLGHAQGDHVLAVVAERLREVVKFETKPGSLVQPLLARLAGDEFTALFPSIREEGDAERIAQKALMALGEPFETGGQTIYMGASIGIAFCPDHGDDLTSLMRAADVSMYHAKASGRSQICFFHPRMTEEFERRTRTEVALRQGLIRQEFDLVYQPQICTRTGAVIAVEALIRWNHPTDGVRLPDSFIPIAEESSLIVDMGDWVIERVAEVAAQWHQAGRTHRLTCNISPKQVERADFFERLGAAMKRAGAPLSLLELEFTETLAMNCGPDVIAELAKLRAAGAAISIDDFGSGYSNLVRMKDMPLDRVKLDRSLISEIDISEGARTIVSAVIHLIHGLGCEVVGEGVERQEQLDVLRAIGCDIVQGFAFAEPMSEAEFLAWSSSDSIPSQIQHRLMR